jgi:hypothetical protein
MESKKKLRILGWLFWAAVLVSLGATLSNYTNYLGLLESMNEVIYSIDRVSHQLEESKVEFTINFSLTNPTSYNQLKFSSLQCQLYLVDGEQEHYLGATGYALPVDVPLHPDETRRYTTMLSISANDLILQANGTPLPELVLRVRSVIHFSTPQRRYYQTISINQKSMMEPN